MVVWNARAGRGLFSTTTSLRKFLLVAVEAVGPRDRERERGGRLVVLETDRHRDGRVTATAAITAKSINCTVHSIGNNRESQRQQRRRQRGQICVIERVAPASSTHTLSSSPGGLRRERQQEMCIRTTCGQCLLLRPGRRRRR